MSAFLFAVMVWWTSNTIAHHFIHRPFFRRRSANRLFAIAMSAATGIPQALWRDRHLAHHAGVARRLRVSIDLMTQVAVVAALWAMLVDRAPLFFATVYVPGYLGGLLLCAAHGHYEHAGGTVSHYGRLYNLLLFNDGYHVEHHAHPGVRWSRLPERRDPRARASAWPAPLRWLDGTALDMLERLVLRSRVLQRFVLRTHGRALRDLVAHLPPVHRIAIVGGGLFPRSALILRSLLPAAEITIIDGNRANLDRARMWISSVPFVHAHYSVSDVSDVSDPSEASEESDTSDTSDTRGYDLVVIPLAFDGDREVLYTHPPAPAVIVHDWIWRRRAISRIVSIALLKRVNLVRR